MEVKIMDVQIIELICGIAGLLIGLAIASGASVTVKNQSQNVCCPSPGTIVVLDSDGNTYISKDSANSWVLTGKWKH